MVSSHSIKTTYRYHAIKLPMIIDKIRLNYAMISTSLCQYINTTVTFLCASIHIESVLTVYHVYN